MKPLRGQTSHFLLLLTLLASSTALSTALPSSSATLNQTTALQNHPPTPGTACIRAQTYTPLFHIRTYLWTLHLSPPPLPKWGTKTPAAARTRLANSLLANLRSMCGDIQSWSAEPDGGYLYPNSQRRSTSSSVVERAEGEQGLQILFYNPICTMQQVQGAVLWASIAVAGGNRDEGVWVRKGDGGEVGGDVEVV